MKYILSILQLVTVVSKKHAAYLFLVFLVAFCSTVSAQDTTAKKITPRKSATVNVKELEQKEKALPLSERQKKIQPGPDENTRPAKTLPIPPNARIIRSTIIPGKIDTLKKNDLRPGVKKISPELPGLIDNLTTFPPDIGGAVSADFLVETLNSQILIANKAGTAVSTVTLAGFFAPLTTAPDVFDPHVVYDNIQRRWLITAAANRRSATSGIVVGVSDNNDPTSTWHLYLFDCDATDNFWLDYPQIGLNRNWVSIAGNLFANPGVTTSSNPIIYVFDKTALYAGGAPTATTFIRMGSSFCPAYVNDNTTNDLLVGCNWNGNSGGSGFLGFYTISGTAASPALSASASFVSVASPWGNGAGTNFAQQQGSTTGIENNDSRIAQMVLRNGSLWLAQTAFLPAASPTHSAAQWWQINPATLAVIQFGRVEVANTFFAFPSIDVNAYNDVVLGFSRFSSTQFASSNFAFRLHTDPVNTMQMDAVFHNGLASYVKIVSGRNRWGDYTSTITDPDLFTVWTVQEYAQTPQSGQDRWATEWQQVSMPVPSLYVKDAADDAGAEPDPSTAPMWQSNDIWVRKSQDAAHAFAHMHEDAEYRTNTFNPNYVYVEVHNRGGAPSSGTEQLTLYWAKAGSALNWPNSWNGSSFFDPGTNAMLMGAPIATVTVPVIAAGSSSIMEFSWMPPNPATYTGPLGLDINHFCLLARITSSTTAPYGMTFPEGMGLYTNVQNNNKIAWKNISVFNLNTGDAPAYAMAGNFTTEKMMAKFRFQFINTEGMQLQGGALKITAEGKLKEILKAAQMGEGIKNNGDGTFLVEKNGSMITNVLLDPNDYGTIKMEFSGDRKSLGKGFAVLFTQLQDINGTETIIGGQTFVFGQVKGIYTGTILVKGTTWKAWYWIIIGLILLILIWLLRRKK